MPLVLQASPEWKIELRITLILCYGGELDFSLARIVEPKQPIESDKIVAPQQLFPNYRRFYPEVIVDSL